MFKSGVRAAAALLFVVACDCGESALKKAPEPPSQPTITLEPAAPKTADELRAIIVAPSVDPEGRPFSYSYSWSKDEAPQTDLTSDTVPAALTTKGERWKVSVVATNGLASAEAVTAETVIRNTPPEAEVKFDPARPDAFSGIRAVPAPRDADGDAVNHWFVWTKDGQPAVFDTDTVPAIAVARGQKWSVTVTPNDGTDDGLTSTADVTIGNALPTVDGVTLSPAVPTKASSVIARPGAVTDADGDATTLRFAWSVDGTVVAGQTSSTLSPLYFSRGQRITVVVSAFDGFEEGPAVVAATTVGNAPPTVTAATIDPQSGGRGTTFTCAPVGWSDADGDPEQYVYAWTVDGAPFGNTRTIDGLSLAKGQSITCTITPVNEGVTGTPVTSDAVVIANTPPTLTGVTLSPTIARRGELLTAQPQGWFDADGDGQQVRYVWRRNGALIPNRQGAVLPGSELTRGDRLLVEATPFDGTDVGPMVASAELVVANTPPVLASVALSPSSPTKEGPITASLGLISDADSDTVTVAYRWKVNGFAIAGQTGSSLAADYFAKGQSIEVTATPNDGIENGAPMTASVTVGNALPSITGVSVTPATGTRADTFTCAPQGWSDVDGDVEEYLYEWRADGAVVGNTSTLAALALSRGQSVTCTVTPANGSEYGASRTSEAVTLRNTAPTLASVTIAPTTAYKGTSLTATPVSFSDPDGDTASYRFSWYRDGGLIAGQAGPTLPGSAVAKGQRISASVEPYDGIEYGAAKTSNEVTILNSAPTIAGVTLSPMSPTKGDTITATPGATSDVDGDTVSLRYAWSVNGSPVAGQTGSSLAPTFFAKGQVVTVTVIPNDGTSDGTPATASSSAAENSAPTVSSVVIAPVGGGTAVNASVVDSTVTKSDLDGDNVTLTYVWKVSNSAGVKTVGGNTAQLPAGLVVHNDVLQLFVTPSDGLSSGAQVASNSLVIGNTPPTQPTVTLSPTSPRTTDVLTCTASGSTDADGESVIYTFTWTRNGAAFTGAAQTGNVSTVAANTQALKDLFTCSATPSDGYGSGSASAITTAVYVGCGDGVLQLGEQCDDGNMTSGDDCDDRCRTEVPVGCRPVLGRSLETIVCSSRVTQEQAHSACSIWGGNLAIPQSGPDNNTLLGAMESSLSREADSCWTMWIGLNDIAQEGNWVTEHGVVPTFTNWYAFTNEPNNSGGNENCAQMYSCRAGSEYGIPGIWNDASCGIMMSYVCER